MRAFSLVLLALTLMLAVAACGGGSTEDTAPENVEGTTPAETEGETGQPEDEGTADGDAAAGEEIFASAGCGNCHTYEPAGTTGTTGPSLDESDIDFEGAVEQITNGGGGMPPFGDQLSEEDIANVAAFVTSG